MPNKVLTYDVECTGFKTHQGARMFSFATCTMEGASRVARLDGTKCKAWSQPQCTPAHARKSLEYLESIWLDPSIELSMHNAQFDMEHTEFLLGRSLRRVRGKKKIIHDTMAMSHILQNLHSGHALSRLGWELAGYPEDMDDQVHEYSKGGRLNYQQIPEEIMHQYQIADVERGALLHTFFYPKIIEGGYQEVYEMECDLAWTTIDMMRRGVMINRSRTERLISQLEADADLARKTFQSLVGERINPGSDDSVRWLLFKRMGFPITKKTKTGKPSVDKEVLIALRQQGDFPVLECILQYRAYQRGVSILQGYLDQCDSNDIIHPSIRRFGAKTGRESVSQPNLQNVSKSEVRNVPYPIPARKCFRPKPGMINLHIDYKGIEMRLLIEESGDSRMIEIMQRNEDPHDAASAIFYRDEFKKAMRLKHKSKKWAKKYKALRDNGKNCNFAVPYGAGMDKLGRMLRLPPSEGESRFLEYQRTFPDLCGLSQRVAQEVRDQGYVTTRFGRKLNVPRQRAYAGTNYLIQGTAAGILKRAQVRVDNYLREATGGEVGIILPIHDELVIEVPRKRLGDMRDILGGIRERMVDFPQFKVPMDIDIEYCTVDWDSVKEFKVGGDDK